MNSHKIKIQKQIKTDIKKMKSSLI